jgi:hypothetical protein
MTEKKGTHRVPINPTHDSIMFSFYWLKNFVIYSYVTNMFVERAKLSFILFFSIGFIDFGTYKKID